MGTTEHARCGSAVLWLFFLACTSTQVLAFVPPFPARQRLDSTTIAPTRQNNNNNNNNNRRRRRTRSPGARAASSTPSEGASKGNNHGATTVAADAAAASASGAAHVPDEAEAADATSMAATAAGTPPAYRRLYDTAMGLLEKELGLEPYPIPEGLEGNKAVVGKGRSLQTVETSITAFRSSKFRQIRTALVESDGPIQVLNLVMFPYPSYDLPIFGADLVSLPGVHLICIDLQPAHPAQERDDKTDAAMREAHKRHVEALPWGGDLPEAAQKFFSPHCLWAKLGSKEAVEHKALEAMMDYLKEYIRLAKEAEPVQGDDPLEKITAGHAEYSKYRRENDPARGMLTRFYGADWTEAAIGKILFDFTA